MLSRDWLNKAVGKIEADYNRSADTHLHKMDIPGAPDINLYFKDESTHPTGSLKHRLARSLFLYGLCNGWIIENTTIIEASSGSTAVSEAYFAQLLGLNFIAVVPRNTSAEKIHQIEFYGGKCHFVDDPAALYIESHKLAAETSGHFMDQFTYAERATDWRGNNNIAESIFQQMESEDHPQPDWVVVGAGTGGTSATIGRFIRYQGFDTKTCVVDPENSVFADYYDTGDTSLVSSKGSRIEGIGRPKVEASFLPDIIDRVIRVEDTASIAAIHFLETVIGRKCGGSTGTNLIGAFQLIAEMKANNRPGSVVTLICDPGDRYLDSYYNPRWLSNNDFDIAPHMKHLLEFYNTGNWVAK